MSDLDKILDEDVEWRKEFNAMKVTGDCDAGCEKPAKRWFGNTNQATCGDSRCLDVLQRRYNEL